MLQEVREFIQDHHFFSSLISTNSKLSSIQALTANLSAVPHLLAIYKQNNESNDLRSQCLSQRSFSAAKLIVSLQLMEEEIEIVQKPLRLVQLENPKPQKSIVNVESTKLEIGVQSEDIQPKVEESRREMGIGVSCWQSSKSITNKQQSEGSISPIFTEIRIEEKHVRRKVEIVSSNKDHESFDSKILRDSDEGSEYLLNQYFMSNESVVMKGRKEEREREDREMRRGESIETKKLELKDFFRQKPKQVKEFSPQIILSEARSCRDEEEEEPEDAKGNSKEEEEFSHEAEQDPSKPLRTQQTHLHSPFNPPRSSLHQRTHLKITPEVLSVHEVLKANRSNRSRDSERQRHVAEFNLKVEEDLREIKQELKEIKHLHNEISESRLSERRMESRVTSKGTFNPLKARIAGNRKDQISSRNQPRVLKFDISLNSSSTPKPASHLLTMSRSINIRNDSRPTSTSRSKQKTQIMRPKASHQKRRQEKSLESFQKAMEIAKPRHRELLTTRIAKYN